MQIMSRVILVLFLIGSICGVYKYFQDNSDTSQNLAMPVDIDFIQKNYDTLISEEQSPELVRAVHENGFACYHAGIVFPWDSKQIAKKQFEDMRSAWRLAGRCELNRDYYGFLFLGNPTVDSHILDAGCGGGTSSILIEQIFNCRVDGYSLAPKEVEHARTTAIKHNSSDKLRFFEGNILFLPEKDNTYDAIWISESSEYISSLTELFQEMKRVAKDGARIIIFTWVAKTDLGKKNMDSLYRTALHKVEEYLLVAKQQGWNLIHQQNLRDWMIPYFNFIVKSKLYTDERNLIQMFLSGDLDYYLLCFDIQK